MDLSEFSRLENKKVYSRHPWETSRIKVLQRLLTTSEINFPIERIVDIGSGDSFVIHNLAEKQVAKHYFAIDTAHTPEVIALLKGNNNDSIIYLQSLAAYFEHYPSDVPTLFLCMDVLEHLENEKEILDELRVKKDNYYYFAVPAFQSVFSGHDVLLGHFRRYTLNGLENILISNEFKILDKGYYFSSLLIFRRFDSIFNKKKEISIDNWKGGKMKTVIISNILKMDFAFAQLLKKLGITIPGLSCYCLCKK